MLMPHHAQSDIECLGRLPLHRPFTTAEARDLGATPRQLGRLTDVGLLRRPVRGVYVPASLPDTLELRVSVLQLVVPPDCTVTDRTAGWLWAGERLLAPNDHLATPLVSVFAPPGRRLRNGLVASGERKLEERDVVVLGGVRVTTALRTACDLGRRLHGGQALGALDVLAGIGQFDLAELAEEERRFKGYRGVCQLRYLIPLADPRCRWPSESDLRLKWHAAGLPRPECQVEVETPWGSTYFIDMGLPDERFGAEYDGAEFHGEDRQVHDTGRRDWLKQAEGWWLVIARNEDLHGPKADIEARLRAEYERAKDRWRP